MRNPKELAKSFDNVNFIEFISLVQKEAYNQAIKDVLRELLKTDIYRQPIGKEIIKLKIK